MKLSEIKPYKKNAEMIWKLKGDKKMKLSEKSVMIANLSEEGEN